MTQVSEAEAIRLYPELELLRTIKAAGWTFRTRLDGAGELLAIEGWRDWPEGWRDAIVISDSTDACAGRALADDLVWCAEGTLNDVVAGLLVLPAPSDPAAPRLVMGTAPLWTPWHVLPSSAARPHPGDPAARTTTRS